MLRDKWEFQYLGKDLSDRLTERIRYERERIAAWKAELDAAEADLRAKGVAFRQQPITGGHRLETVLDQERQQRVQIAHNKIDGHRQRLDAYLVFEEALRESPDAELRLHADDVRFFSRNVGEVEE